MGSLMSGWNSAALDPKTVKFQRNKSLTREEIDAYWRAKKNDEEHNSGVSSPVAGTTNQENIKKFRRSESLPLNHRRDSMMNNEEIHNSRVGSSVGINKEKTGRVTELKKFQRSESMPTSSRRDCVLNSVSNQDAEKHILRQGWWTSCSSAFLNETPVVAMDGPAYKYASQYHYTRFGSV